MSNNNNNTANGTNNIGNNNNNNNQVNSISFEKAVKSAANPSSSTNTRAQLLLSSFSSIKIQQQQLKKRDSRVELSQQKARRPKFSSSSGRFRMIRNNADKSNESFSNSDFSNKQVVNLPSFYSVNIGREGSRFMDYVHHVNEDDDDRADSGGENTIVEQLRQAECKLRPISGVRNHINRNHSAKFHTRGHNLLAESDLVEHISRLATSLKRLDLSHNNLSTYPTELCSLYLLESLNLSSNRIGSGDSPHDLDLPPEIECLTNLTEIILDDNVLKRIPTSLSRCKRLSRLSICNNFLVDLKNIEPLKRLKCLVVENNSLTHLDDSLRALEKLEYLHAGKNSIHMVQFSLFKTNLKALRHIDLSGNKLQTVSTELFMLPLLECLNLSNNAISRLPVVHSAASTTMSKSAAQIRSIPLYSLDLSGNLLNKFPDYVLHLATVVDLSENRIKTLPKKTISRLSESELMSRVLKLDENPLIDPPLEVCQYGLKSIQEYFENESRQIQLNKGFKIILLGNCKSGKTCLACALEDFYTKSNQMEQYLNVDDYAFYDNKIESKFIEIHEFYVSMEDDEAVNETRDQVVIVEPIKPVKVERKISVPQQRPFYSRPSSNRRPYNRSPSSRPTSSRPPSSRMGSASKLGKLKRELNAFSNSKLKKQTSQPLEPEALVNTNIIKKQILPVTIYDFNGSLKQYTHIMDTFLDKNALIIICVDSSKLDDEDETNYLNDLLDIIILKMSKTTSFCVLPVLTKCDILLAQTNDVRVACERLKLQISVYMSKKLEEIRNELKKFENQSQINASHSDRLKQLAQTQSHLNNFDIFYKNSLPLAVSSVKMLEIDQLADFIKEIVTTKKAFADVNKKVPVFWVEVENYACNKLIDITTTTASQTTTLKWTQQQSINMLCIEYNEYKEHIVEKYGMSHLVEQITKYMNASGRILWYYESDKLKRKVFLRPCLLFDMLFVLFRARFMENFEDAHLHALRLKLIRDSVDTSETHIRELSENMLNKGHAHIDLLKLIWYPILITDSSTILRKSLLVLMSLFQIAYPVICKDKLKILVHHSTSVGGAGRSQRKSIHSAFQEFDSILAQINEIVVPFYLPLIDDSTPIEKARSRLRHEWSQAVSTAVHAGLKNKIPKLVSNIAHKYTFQWGLMPGIFERFSVNCLFNSDLYYTSHYKNFIYAHNEDNTIGVIIHTNLKEHEEKCSEVVFEFYLTSYHQILESLQESNRTRNESTTQTLSMELDQIWILALRVLHLFEETILNSFPSLRYDRWSQCPECECFSFMGEWLTPKELQKLKCKVCPNCTKTIDYSFLVKPSAGQNLILDMKKIHQRLENIARMHEARLQSTSQAKTSITFSSSDIFKNE